MDKVLNNAEVYPAEVQEWALAAIQKKPWALCTPISVILTPEMVKEMKKALALSES
ncbi:MAG: hypothetical protein Q9M37_08885 [Desulfonauticus sp.]|nr:hypothetical protein [Desulfonauticus sp.]